MMGATGFPPIPYADENLVTIAAMPYIFAYRSSIPIYVKGRATVTVTDDWRSFSGNNGQHNQFERSSKEIDGGVLNSRPWFAKPKYPEAARVPKLQVRVTVKILLDEKGNIVSAEGSTAPRNFAPPQSKQQEARFTLTLIGTRPVKVLAF